MRPARVHPVKVTSATSTGCAHTASRAWSAGSGVANGEVSWRSGASCSVSWRSARSVNPVPLTRPPATDHGLLPPHVLDLAPAARPLPRLVARLQALGHDAFQVMLQRHRLHLGAGLAGERGR